MKTYVDRIRELREDQRPVSAVNSGIEKLPQGFPLRGAAPVILIDQGRIAAQLPQPRQFREDPENRNELWHNRFFEEEPRV